MRRFLLMAGLAAGLGGCASVSPGYYGQPALFATPTEAWAPPVLVPGWAYPGSVVILGPGVGYSYVWGAPWWGWRSPAWWGPPAHAGWARWPSAPAWAPRPAYPARAAVGPRPGWRGRRW